MTMPNIAAHEQLRAWAKGNYPLEAATELLIRAFDGRFVEAGWPWIHPTKHGQWIDFATIPVQIGSLSGGEQRLLRIAASIGSSKTSVNLGDCVNGLDRPRLQLVLAAVARAAGSHEESGITIAHDGTICATRLTSPHPRRVAAGGNPSAATAIRRSL